MPVSSDANRLGCKPILRQPKRKQSVCWTKSYLMAFTATLSILAATNLPVLRAMAAASVSVKTAGHITGIAINAPKIRSHAPGIPVLPMAPVARKVVGVVPRAIATISPALGAQPNHPPVKQKSTLPFGLFGSLEFRTNAAKGTDAWRKALAKLDNEKPLYEFCDAGSLSCPPKYQDWRALLSEIRHLPEDQQLARLNRGINALISHGEDADIFSVRDHWASPMEFLQTGGDCEDFTILKYVSLLELGFADYRLRIVVVEDTDRHVYHAILAVAGQQGAIILDSLADTPVLHSQIKHYRPIYSVSRHDRWIHIATQQISSMYAARNIQLVQTRSASAVP